MTKITCAREGLTAFTLILEAVMWMGGERDGGLGAEVERRTEKPLKGRIVRDLKRA